MDLKKWMFCKRIQPSTMAKILGCCPRNLRMIIDRANRPRGDLAHRIEFVTRKEVTVDELIHPGKYPVEWEGDKAKGRIHKKACIPVAIDSEIKDWLREQMKKHLKKKLSAGEQSEWMKGKIAGQNEQGSDTV